LIIGLQRSAIGTLVERTTRFTMLVHLPREEGYGLIPRTKNGPALAGYGAVTMTNALAKTITTLPEQLRRSLTWDRGKELSDHARFTVESGVKVFFADPHSPWQRGTNENGLLRQYFRRAPTWPDGTSSNSTPSRTPSTPDRGKRSAGRPPPRPSTNVYDCLNNPVLRRPVESVQYVAVRYTERLAEAGAVASVGSTGDSYDNALAEAFNSLFKAELVRNKGPWRGIDDLEIAVAEYIDWFNHRRLHGEIRLVPPDELETEHYRQNTTPAPAEAALQSLH